MVVGASSPGHPEMHLLAASMLWNLHCVIIAPPVGNFEFSPSRGNTTPTEPGKPGARLKWSRLTSPRPKAASSDCALRAKCFRKLQCRKPCPSRARLLRNVEVQRLHPVPRWGAGFPQAEDTPPHWTQECAQWSAAEAVVNLTTTAARCRTSSKTGASRPPGCGLDEGCRLKRLPPACRYPSRWACRYAMRWAIRPPPAESST